ncbi:D-glycero-beta-D-manno-heptose 1,7-bisphosphate 7-phosphatase [Bermanella sp. R86510]|uniref:D-glycero-beta-D-manno-heptose 1,7-bisphosphate 7-phosphatase n=1 Tax=unclassified Bermanella TaxID=2627862 RepID=UPI0037CC10E2
MPDKIIVLDRDGVINLDSDEYVKTLDEWQPITGSIKAIALLSKAGYKIAVATNQSGIARGYFDETTLAQMHEKMRNLVKAEGGEIDYITYCPHGPDDNCQCRKPLPGLIDQIEQLSGLSCANSYMVGDSLRDLQAGVAKGLKPVLVLTGKGQRTLDKGMPLDDVAIFDDLLEFSEWLLTQ